MRKKHSSLLYIEKEKKNKSLKDSEQNSSNDKEIISKRFVIIFIWWSQLQLNTIINRVSQNKG